MLYNPKSKTTSFSCPLGKTSGKHFFQVYTSSGKHQMKSSAGILQAMCLNPIALSLRGNEISPKTAGSCLSSHVHPRTYTRCISIVVS